MDVVSGWFVGNPVLILLIGAVYAVAYLLVRFRGSERLRAQALLLPAIAWTVWAVWEFFVTRFSPEANIRVDLLLIVPIVLILSVVGIVGVFWPKRH